MNPRLFLIFFFFLLANLAHAQDSLITAKKTLVDSIMNVSKSKLMKETITTDTKLPISIFINQDQSITLYYYDSDNICNQCASTYKNTNVDAVKKIINQRFDEQDETHWLRRDKKVKAELVILKELIVVKYTKV